MTKNEFTGKLITEVMNQMPRNKELIVVISEREYYMQFGFEIEYGEKKWSKGVQVQFFDIEANNDPEYGIKMYAQMVAQPLLSALKDHDISLGL